MRNTNAYQNAVEINKISSEQAKKEIILKGNDISGKENCTETFSFYA